MKGKYSLNAPLTYHCQSYLNAQNKDISLNAGTTVPRINQ